MHCFTATYENKKYQHGTFVLSTLALHLTELSKVFQAGCFNQLYTEESFCRTVHQEAL